MEKFGAPILGLEKRMDRGGRSRQLRRLDFRCRCTRLEAAREHTGSTGISLSAPTLLCAAFAILRACKAGGRLAAELRGEIEERVRADERAQEQNG